MIAPQPEELASHFLAACRAELHALKPGNVHVHADGHGMDIAHFEAAAKAAAPWICDATLSPGVRILCAVEESLAAANCNTNLGILLLCSPLAAAAQQPGKGSLRQRLAGVLGALDDEDATAVFEAIRLANPGRIKTVPDQDITAPPTVGLIEAMALAADRDRIAHAYTTDFEEIFAFGLPELLRARASAERGDLAVTTLHMAFLAALPDSHIFRKFGQETAEEVRTEARRREAFWRPSARPETIEALLTFDSVLKARHINPGTTADFVVATLFAEAISADVHPSTRV